MCGASTQCGRRERPLLTGADRTECAWVWADALVIAASEQRTAGATRTADRLLDAASAMMAAATGWAND